MKSECMDLETLTAYIDGCLPDKEKDAVEKHLADCDECLEEFVIANSLLNDSGLTEYESAPLNVIRTALQEVREKIKKKISDWMMELSPPPWILGHDISPVRSDAASPVPSILVKKNINEFHTEMYFEKAGDKKARVWIRVLRGNQNAKNVSLTLIRDDGVPFARFLKREYVIFDRQSFGSYHLSVEQNPLENTSSAQSAPYLFEVNSEGFYEK